MGGNLFLNRLCEQLHRESLPALRHLFGFVVGGNLSMALNTLIAKLDTKSRSTLTKVLFIPLESSFLHLTLSYFLSLFFHLML